MRVNQPFIPFIHYIWGETVLWRTVFIIQTSDRMRYFRILQYKLHAFNIQDDRSTKILIVRYKNTTYFIWIKKKETCACDHLKTTNLSADNFKKYLSSMGRHPSPRYGQVILVSGYPVLTAVNWSQHWCPICVHYQFSCALKLASKTINWSADSFQINHVTSMSWHMSPRYGHVILVNVYPVLTAVNWPFCKCPIYKIWTCQDKPETPLPLFW